MTVASIQDLFVNELRDIHSAEKQLTRVLPRIAKAAQHAELREAFESHLEETRGQVERANETGEAEGQPVRGTPGRKAEAHSAE